MGVEVHDVDKVKKEIEKFREDIGKLKEETYSLDMA